MIRLLIAWVAYQHHNKSNREAARVAARHSGMVES